MCKINLENVSKICEEIANTAIVEFKKVQRRVDLVDMEKPIMLQNEPLIGSDAAEGGSSKRVNLTHYGTTIA